MFKRTRTLGLVFGAAMAAMAGLSPLQAAEVKIGAIFPLSGPNADYGETFMSGAELAVGHINADKLLSGPLKVAYEDSQAMPQPAVVAMNKLVNVEQVPFVLSAFTGVSKAIAPLGARSKIVAVNGGGVAPDLAELGNYFWNVIPLANLEVHTMGPYLVQERGLKRIAVIYLDDPLGEAMINELKTVIPAVGGELVASIQIPRTAQQFGSIAAQVRDAKPDAIYLASFGGQQVQLIKQLRDNGVTQVMAGYSGLDIPPVHSAPEAKGVLYTTQRIDWDSSEPMTQRFVADYKAKYNKMPNSYIANYYNATMLFGILAAELEKAGEPITGEKLLQRRMAHSSFKLVGGTMIFRADGTVSMPIQISEIDGNGGRIVK